MQLGGQSLRRRASVPATPSRRPRLTSTTPRSSNSPRQSRTQTGSTSARSPTRLASLKSQPIRRDAQAATPSSPDDPARNRCRHPIHFPADNPLCSRNSSSQTSRRPQRLSIPSQHHGIRSGPLEAVTCVSAARLGCPFRLPSCTRTDPPFEPQARKSRSASSLCHHLIRCPCI